MWYHPFIHVADKGIAFNPGARSPLDGTNITSQPTFRSQWKTDNPGVSASNQIKIPTFASGTYNATADWDDGNIETGLTTFDDPRWTHTYSSAGTFNIKITGTMTGIRFANGGDKLKILEISEWGVLNFGNFNGYLHGCSNLVITATDPLDLTGTTGFNNAFRGCQSANSFIGNWDFSNVTSMVASFLATPLFTGADFGSRDIGNVVTMFSIFAASTGVTTSTLDDMYIGWPGLLPNLQSNVPFDVGTVQYSAGAAADGKDDLLAIGWTFVDGGEKP